MIPYHYEFTPYDYAVIGGSMLLGVVAITAIVTLVVMRWLARPKKTDLEVFDNTDPNTIIYFSGSDGSIKPIAPLTKDNSPFLIWDEEYKRQLNELGITSTIITNEKETT